MCQSLQISSSVQGHLVIKKLEKLIVLLDSKFEFFGSLWNMKIKLEDRDPGSAITRSAVPIKSMIPVPKNQYPRVEHFQFCETSVSFSRPCQLFRRCDMG